MMMMIAVFVFRIPDNDQSFAKVIGIFSEIESVALIARDTRGTSLQADTIQVVRWSIRKIKATNMNSKNTFKQCNTFKFDVRHSNSAWLTTDVEKRTLDAKNCFCKTMKYLACDKSSHLRKTCFAAKFKWSTLEQSREQTYENKKSTEIFAVDNGAGNNFC